MMIFSNPESGSNWLRRVMSPVPAHSASYGTKATKMLLFHRFIKSGANLMWVDEAGSIIAPELECLVIVWSNFDVKSTHQCISASKFFQFIRLFAVGRHFSVKRVVRCNEPGRISALDENIHCHLMGRRRCLTNMSCVTSNYWQRTPPVTHINHISLACAHSFSCLLPPLADKMQVPTRANIFESS